VALSTQEIINCDENNFKCEGGFINRALNWGKKNGFITEECLPFTAEEGECGDMMENECRYDKNFYKVNDYCLADGPENIKKEIFKNGPVAAQMSVYTDFLTYSSGVYHRTEDAFKFNGQHVVKIVGWVKNVDGQESWIFENTWGEDWGDKGFGRVMIGDSSVNMDMAGMGMAAIPMSQRDLEMMQKMQAQQQMMGDPNSFGEENIHGVDEIIEEAEVVEEEDDE
jgi:cathepsin B